METLGKIVAVIAAFAILGVIVSISGWGLLLNRKMWQHQLQKKVGSVPEFAYLPREVHMGCAPLGLWLMGGVAFGVLIAIAGGVFRSTPVAAIGGIVAFVSFLPGGLMLLAYQTSEGKAVEPEFEHQLPVEKQNALRAQRIKRIEALRDTIQFTDQTDTLYPFLVEWKIQYQIDQVRSDSQNESVDATIIDLDELDRDFGELEALEFKECPKHVLKSWKKIVEVATKS